VECTRRPMQRVLGINNNDLSELWYQKNPDGSIEYSRLGLTTYRAMFDKVGIDIDEITTVEEHQMAVKKSAAVSAKGN